MHKIKKHIAVFLLFVFSFVALPPSLWHDAFAHHTDTAYNYCDYYHKDLGTHIENSHTSCAVFKTNTPVYDALKITNTVSVFRVIVSECKIAEVIATSHTAKINLPARAPPIA